ncbi:macrophage mannose receptor 1 [Elysia marginata]|uniref:Macrophage mannose receptor 1 n=1 Tax=Elysia marginata TaxID=1093978 RepID=A0AAV4FU22_9GAST|nr:macrophage mannose receptor 1 [Elysia marginata]
MSLFQSFFFTFSEAKDVCPSGYDLFQGSCYKLGYPSLGFFRAQRRCNIDGGHLAEITSQEENDHVKSLLRDAAANIETGAYIGAVWYEENTLSGGSGWEWEENLDEVIFSDWADPAWQPDSSSYQGQGYCAMMSQENDWAWAAQDCETREGMVAVCERQPAHEECFQDSCYQLFHDYTYQFEFGHKCKSLGGKALEINSEEESDFIQGFLDAAPARKDAFGTFSLTEVWLGASDSDSEGDFRWWSDDSELDFDNWGPGQPNNGAPNGAEENCVVLESSEGWKWKDVSCDDARAVVCEIEDEVSGITG